MLENQVLETIITIERKERRDWKKDEREKQLLTKGKRLKVVRFLISPNKKKVKIEVNKIMNPAFLLGTAFNIAYWHRKYHSGTICKGVRNQECNNLIDKMKRNKWKLFRNPAENYLDIKGLQVLQFVFPYHSEIIRKSNYKLWDGRIIGLKRRWKRKWASNRFRTHFSFLSL